MQRFEFLRQPLMGELAMSPEERKKEREKNAIYSGQLRLYQQPRAAHALRSDQNITISSPIPRQQLPGEDITSFLAKQRNPHDKRARRSPL